MSTIDRLRDQLEKEKKNHSNLTEQRRKIIWALNASSEKISRLQQELDSKVSVHEEFWNKRCGRGNVDGYTITYGEKSLNEIINLFKSIEEVTPSLQSFYEGLKITYYISIALYDEQFIEHEDTGMGNGPPKYSTVRKRSLWVNIFETRELAEEFIKNPYDFHLDDCIKTYEWGETGKKGIYRDHHEWKSSSKRRVRPSSISVVTEVTFEGLEALNILFHIYRKNVDPILSRNEKHDNWVLTGEYDSQIDYIKQQAIKEIGWGPFKGPGKWNIFTGYM